MKEKYNIHHHFLLTKQDGGIAQKEKTHAFVGYLLVEASMFIITMYDLIIPIQNNKTKPKKKKINT
jgi:hypothetical protein